MVGWTGTVAWQVLRSLTLCGEITAYVMMDYVMVVYVKICHSKGLSISRVLGTSA